MKLLFFLLGFTSATIAYLLHYKRMRKSIIQLVINMSKLVQEEAASAYQRGVRDGAAKKDQDTGGTAEGSTL